MSLVDILAFLFTTNAKQAEKDVESFGKTTQNVQDKLNNADKTATALGFSFSKLALAGVAALESYASLGKLKDGIVNAINYNAAIEKSAKLTGINARELAIWNGVVAQAGGNPGSQEYLNFITKLNQQYAGVGLNQRIKFVNRDLAETAEKIKQLNAQTPGAGYAFAQKLNIGDDLYLALQNGKEGLQELVDKEERLNNTTDKSAESALRLKRAWAQVGTQFTSAFTAFEPFAEIIANVAGDAAKLLRIFVDLFTLDGWKDLAQLGSKDFNIPLDNKAIPGEYVKGKPVLSGSAQEQSRVYWKSLGYSNAQIAALLSNENAESGFNAVNHRDSDGLIHSGIFQWSPARRARILAGTGIDVANADHADQLKAAAWELDATGTSGRLRGASTPEQGASILTAYENPANAAYQARVRGESAENYFHSIITTGQNALSSANATPLPGSLGGNQKTVTIGSITINTQATDAKGIALDLKSELASTVASYDDGVKH